MFSSEQPEDMSQQRLLQELEDTKKQLKTLKTQGEMYSTELKALKEAGVAEKKFQTDPEFEKDKNESLTAVLQLEKNDNHQRLLEELEDTKKQLKMHKTLKEMYISLKHSTELKALEEAQVAEKQLAKREEVLHALSLWRKRNERLTSLLQVDKNNNRILKNQIQMEKQIANNEMDKSEFMVCWAANDYDEIRRFRQEIRELKTQLNKNKPVWKTICHFLGLRNPLPLCI